MSKPTSLEVSDTKTSTRLGTPSHISNEDQERSEAIKYALIHLLAMKPADVKSISRTVHVKPATLQPILKRFAEEDKNGVYNLTNKTFKDVEPWSFSYSSQGDRQAAIDNTIRAYDRLRIDPKDEIWQKLLPSAERGQGKTLSKLKLQAPKVPTPMVKATKILNQKPGQVKRTETKKVSAGEKNSELKVVDRADRKVSSKPKTQKVESGPQKKTLAEKREAARKRDEDSKKEQERRKALQAAKSANNSTSSHDSKPSSQSKALLNKPKNPSPLSASPPVNASDFEDGHPLNKSHSAGSNSTKPNGINRLKRPAEEINGNNSRPGISKKPRTDSPSLGPRANPVPPKPPATKRPPPEDSSSSSLDNTPLKMRRMVNGDATTRPRPNNHVGNTNRVSSRQQPLSNAMVNSSDDSSGASPNFSLSWRQRVDLAEKFQRFYGRYKKFYIELESRSERPSSAQREKLADMHNKLAEMKKQLSTGSLRP